MLTECGGLSAKTDCVFRARSVSPTCVTARHEAVWPKRKFNIAKVWGIARHLDLKFIEPEDRVFEERSLLWEDSGSLPRDSDRGA